MTSKRDSAIALAKQGRRVFPLIPNGKTPAHQGNWRKTASKDPARVAEMWTDPVMESEQDWNIGVALDQHTLVVDVDVRNGKKGAESLRLLEAIYDELPPTYTITTASGGEHRYYTVEDSGVFAKTLATDIDLKGEGGYVVGPGSEIDGRRYVDGGHHLVDAPSWFLQHAGAGTRTRTGPTGNAVLAVVELDSESAIARAKEWLENQAPEAIEGAAGDNTTIQVANRVGDFGISLAKATELMHDWNDTKASPPWDPDELEEKVASAFRSRQNPIGIASAEAEFGAVEIDSAKPIPSKRRGLYFITWQDAKPDLAQPYLIDDVMDLGAMVVTYGDSNAGKTYVVLDHGFHIAAGRDWNGHKVAQGLVVHVAAEGGKGFQKRVEAFKRHHKVDNLPFALVPCPIDLHSEQADTGRLVKLIREAEAHFGQRCVLVVIDTLARAMAGGDENTSVDMGKFVDHCDKIRAATGATVNVIHHTGKDKAKGARGSSSLRAATDTEIEIEPGVFAVKKQRDLEKIDKSHFALKAIEVGQRADGKPVTACVVEWIEESEFEVRVTPAAAEMLKLFNKLADARRDEILETEEGDPDAPAVAWDAWLMSCLSHFKGPKGAPVSTAYLYKLRKELVTSGLICEGEQKQWLKGSSNLSNHGVTSSN